MSWFRRRPKPDPTVAVAPPEGMKWVISRTLMVEDGVPLLELGLWHVDAQPDEFGVVSRADRRGIIRLDQPWASAVAYFREDRPHHLRRASVRALAELDRKVESTVSFEELRGRYS